MFEGFSKDINYFFRFVVHRIRDNTSRQLPLLIEMQKVINSSYKLSLQYTVIHTNYILALYVDEI
jgi:hypothetical protein